MKKFFVLTMLAFLVIFIVGQDNLAEARDVHVGKYWHKYDEWDVYLWVESVEIETKVPLQFSCKARSKLATDDSISLSRKYTSYEFYIEDGKLYCDWRMNNGWKGKELVKKGSASNLIYNYVLNNI